MMGCESGEEKKDYKKMKAVGLSHLANPSVGERRCHLLCNSRGCSRRSCRSSFSSSRGNAVGLGLWAVLGDMANLAASVAGFATFAVQWPAVWSSTVPRDMSEFTASVALHRLRLTVARIMVRPTTFVTGSSTRDAIESTAEASSSTTTVATTRSTCATAGTSLVGTVTLVKISHSSGYMRRYALTARWPGWPHV
jgi:hypothetical protein